MNIIDISINKLSAAPALQEQIVGDPVRETDLSWLAVSTNVAMNVLVYSGPKFSEHEKVYAGWMTREAPDSNEAYDPKTVEMKLDLTQDATNCVPVVFDLETREAIYVDLATPRNANWGGNNVESNFASIQDVLRAVTNLGNKPTLHDLFTMHALARGEVVANKADADAVFSIDEGVTPYDVNKINAEFME